MQNIQLEISSFLGQFDLCGIDIMTTDKVEDLERYIQLCNESLLTTAETGNILLEDAVYDRLREILRSVKPDSEMLGLWTEDEVSETNLDLEENKYIRRHPMVSINTIKHLDENNLKEFLNALPYAENEPFSLFYSLKENGHGVREVRRNGQLVTATSRGRSTAGRDLTRQMGLIVGDNVEALANIDLCEIRGEVVLPFSNLELARQHNPNIKTAFTGVSSMIRESATEEETQLLDFVAYKFICDDVTFRTDEEEYIFLESLGYTTPLAVVQEEVTKSTLIECMSSSLEDFEQDIEEYEYFTDGVVCSVNDRGVFEDMGMESGGHYWLGNVALKVNYWKQDMYSGIVNRIEWTDGKSKYSPVAIVTEDGTWDDEKGAVNGVLTASGNTVARIPLYEPNNILLLEAYVGRPLFFRYGGESGVVPCFPTGQPLAEGKLKQMFEDDGDGEFDDSTYI